MTSLGSDVMGSLRRMRANRTYAAGVVLTVALATAAAAVVYAVVDAVLLRPLPYRDPDRLVFIWSTRTDRDKAFFSVPDFLDQRAASRTLADVAAFSLWAGNVAGPESTERLLGTRVTANGLDLLGARAVLGRPLGTEDAAPEAEPVVVLSYGLWKRRFAGSPAALGARLRMDDASYRVVGVLGPDFLFPGAPADMVGVLDLRRDPRRDDRGANFLRAFGRLAPGATPGHVREEWGRTTRELRDRFPATNAKQTEPRVIPLADEMLGAHRRSLLALLAAVAAVLFLASANIATLQTLRTLAREHELAVRRALGASRRHLLRLQALEVGALAMAGCALGLALGRGALDAVVALVPVTLPRAAQAVVDARVATVILSVVLAAIAGCVGLPILALGRASSLSAGLGIGARPGDRPGRRALRQGLAALEVAAAFVLLATTALFLETYRRLETEGPGVRVDGLLQVRLSLPAHAYPTQADLEGYVARVREAVCSEGGARTAAVANALPLSGQNARSDFVVVGHEPPTVEEMPGAQLRWVSPRFAETLGLPVLQGRGIEEHDLQSRAAVALVDEALARQFWKGRDPVGESVRLEYGGPGAGPVFRVVGVVGNVKHFDLPEAPLGTLYLPVHALPPPLRAVFVGNFTLAVAGDVDGAGARRRIAAAIRRLDPEVAASAMTSMRESLERSQAARGFTSALLGLFAAAALLLAASGLYSVVAAGAQGQRRELGLRLCLGATPASVTRRLFWSAARPLSWGLAAGMPLALAAATALGPEVVAEARVRALVSLVVLATLAGASLLAALPPARRAARLDVARILDQG